MDELNDIELLVKKGVSLIAIESFEEPKVLELATRLAIKTFQKVYRWSSTDGLVVNGSTDAILDPDHTPKHDKPEDVLRLIRCSTEPAIYVLCDFHRYFDDDKVVRYLKDIVLYASSGVTIILASHELNLPAEIYRFSSRFRLNFPSEEKIRKIIVDEARDWQKANKGIQVKTDSKTLDRMIGNLRGLTESDVQHLVKGAIYDDGAITISDIDEVNKSKFELMNMGNILSFEFDTAHFADVGGLTGLKTWLNNRKDAFIESSNTNDSPKGIMLLGVQGGGKSLAAKSVAGLWQVPLLRLDMAALYNKYHGETERNLRETLTLADKISPCILWLDEIEKSLAHSDNDGLSKRVLGTLLTWMAERKSQVFIVATSNDISRLPPELVRKGRLDEIFFIDLPPLLDREAIFEIHLSKRNIEIDRNKITHLAELSEGFTGAEIEQAIVSAIYRAKANQDAISSAHIISELGSTVPLSVTRAEEITALRLWAKDRTVLAN